MKALIISVVFFFLLVISVKAQNVGIGTTTPVTKLDIVSGNNWDVVNGEGDVRIGNASYRLKIGLATGGGGAGATSIMQFGQPNGYNVLSLGSQGYNILQLNGGLNSAGIGTDNPGGKLEVTSLSGLPQLMITQQSTGDYARIRFRNGNTAATTHFFDAAAYISSTAVSGDKLSFFHNVAGDVLTITGDGFTGIGTNTPAGRLEVARNTITPQIIATQTDGNEYARFRLRNNNSLSNNRNWDVAGFISSGAASADRFVVYNPSAGNILTITGDGLTGLGTNTPGGKLDITSTSGAPQLQLFQGSTGDYSRIRLKNGNSNATNRYYDIAAFISNTAAGDDRLNFFAAGGNGDILGLAGNGAYYVNGSAGLPGQVLKSAGTAGPTTWVAPMQVTKTDVALCTYAQNEASSDKAFSSGGTATITVHQNSQLMISAHMEGRNSMSGCPLIGSCMTIASIKIYIDGVEKVISNWGITYFVEGNWDHTIHMDLSNAVCTVGPGTHTVELRVARTGTFPLSVSLNYMSVMSFPQ
jgi:hypothetical protein